MTEGVTTSLERDEMGCPADMWGQSTPGTKNSRCESQQGTEDGFLDLFKKHHGDVGSDCVESIDCFGQCCHLTDD